MVVLVVLMAVVLTQVVWHSLRVLQGFLQAVTIVFHGRFLLLLIFIIVIV